LQRRPLRLTRSGPPEPVRDQRARRPSRAAEGEAGPKRDALSQEIWRVASEHEEFAQVILDYFELSQRYEAATGRRSDEED